MDTWKIRLDVRLLGVSASKPPETTRMTNATVVGSVTNGTGTQWDETEWNRRVHEQRTLSHELVNERMSAASNAKQAKKRCKQKSERTSKWPSTLCHCHSTPWNRHNGECGLCGDPVQGPLRHQAGGRFATGTITKTYTQGSTIDITVFITTQHGGWFVSILGPYISRI